MNTGDSIKIGVLLLAFGACAMHGSAQAVEPDARDPVLDWAQHFAGIESGEIVWDAERLSPRPDRKAYEQFRADVFVRYRWPDCLDLQFGQTRGSTDVPRQRQDDFDERVVFAMGQMTELNGQGSRKSFRRSPSKFNLRSSRSVFLDGAPLLAGKWLHEVGLPQGLGSVTRIEPDSFSVDIPSFRVRLTLVPSKGLGASSLVLGMIEFLGKNKQVESSYQYTNFAVPKGLPVAVGYRRHITLASSGSVNGMEDMPPLPLERDDFILDVNVLPRLSDKEFEVSTAGFTDISKPKQGAEPLAPAKEESTTSSARKGAGIEIGTNLLPGVGLGLIIAAVLLALRAKSRAA